MIYDLGFGVSAGLPAVASQLAWEPELGSKIAGLWRRLCALKNVVTIGYPKSS